MMAINPWRRWVGIFIPNWLKDRREVSPFAKMLYAQLCFHANKNTGLAWPRRETLAAELGVSVRNIDRALVELLGQSQKESFLPLLRIVRRGKTQSNYYEFLSTPGWRRVNVH